MEIEREEKTHTQRNALKGASVENVFHLFSAKTIRSSVIECIYYTQSLLRTGKEKKSNNNRPAQ